MAESVRQEGNELVLELDGPRLTEKKFMSALKAFFSILNDVADTASGEKKAVTWIVSVHRGSQLVKAKGTSKKVSSEKIVEICGAINEGLASLNERAKRPRFFSDSSLKQASGLAHIIDIDGKGVERVGIGRNGSFSRLSHKVVAHVEELIGVEQPSIGTIDGRLEVVSARGGFHFSVYDGLTDKRVKCEVGQDKLEAILSAFNHRVTVTGLIRYRRDGLPKSIEVEDFEVIPPDNELPSHLDVKGILKGNC